MAGARKSDPLPGAQQLPAQGSCGRQVIRGFAEAPQLRAQNPLTAPGRRRAYRQQPHSVPPGEEPRGSCAERPATDRRPPLHDGGAGWGPGGPAGGAVAAAVGGHWLGSSRRSAPHGVAASSSSPSSSSRCGEWRRRRRRGVSPRSSFGPPAESSARRRRGRPGSSWWRAWASASTGCTTRWAGSAAPRGRALRAGFAVRPSSAAPARFLPALRKRLAA